MWFTDALANSALQVAVLAPLIWIGMRRRDRSIARDGTDRGTPPRAAVAGVGRTLALIVGVVVVANLVLRLPRFGPFVDLERPWFNLMLLSVALLVFAVLTGRHRAVGLNLPRPGSLRPVLVAALVLTAIGAILRLLGPADDVTFETLAFQLTMPGLSEELLYRGLLWALLAPVLPAIGTLWGAEVSWTLVSTSVLFGFGHGVVIRDGSLQFDIVAAVVLGLVAFGLGWIRARSGSVWPAVLAHNAWNSIGVLVSAVR
ncbi:MAG: lysostaphin resistance A-like protein [Dermatophilaceae bacterium]